MISWQERLYTTKNMCKGETCFILGNGPTLLNYDPFDLRRRWTIGANRSLEHVWSPFYCFCSAQGWENYLLKKQSKGLYMPNYIFCQGIENEKASEGFKAAMIAAGLDLPYQDSSWFFVNPIDRDQLVVNNTSPELRKGLVPNDTLWFLLYIANWLGFDIAFLLGVDMGVGEGHFTGDADPDKSDRSWQANNWNTNLGRIIDEQLDIAVFNCNKDSKLTHFPYCKFETAWEMGERPNVDKTN